MAGYKSEPYEQVKYFLSQSTQRDSAATKNLTAKELKNRKDHSIASCPRITRINTNKTIQVWNRNRVSQRFLLFSLWVTAGQHQLAVIAALLPDVCELLLPLSQVVIGSLEQKGGKQRQSDFHAYEKRIPESLKYYASSLSESVFSSAQKTGK